MLIESEPCINLISCSFFSLSFASPPLFFCAKVCDQSKKNTAVLAPLERTESLCLLRINKQKTGRSLITLHKKFYLSFISLLNSSLTNFSCSPSFSLPSFSSLGFCFLGFCFVLKSRASPLPLEPKLEICPCNSTLSPLTRPPQPSGPLRLGFFKGGEVGHGVR